MSAQIDDTEQIVDPHPTVEFRSHQLRHHGFKLHVVVAYCSTSWMARAVSTFHDCLAWATNIKVQPSGMNSTSNETAKDRRFVICISSFRRRTSSERYDGDMLTRIIAGYDKERSKRKIGFRNGQTFGIHIPKTCATDDISAVWTVSASPDIPARVHFRTLDSVFIENTFRSDSQAW